MSAMSSEGPDRIAPWSDEEGARRAGELFRTTYGEEPEGIWAAPGRVNLIGEHVDYNGGRCLPVALPHRTFAAIRRRADDTIRLVSAQATSWRGTLDELAPGWVTYLAGPAWAMREAGHRVGGFDVAVDSCVPLGAGLSSSAAVECAMALAHSELGGLGLGDTDTGRAELAALCVRAENLVAPTGGMDQAVSLRARAGHALLFDSSDAGVRQVRLPLEADGLRLLVIDTRAEHALHDGQYGARRDSCVAACAQLGIGSLREVTDLSAALGTLADPVQRRRVRHVVTEMERVRQTVRLLDDGALREVGPLLDASHASLRDDYEVSCLELDLAVAAARDAGALGARMTGGGFGGSAIALVEAGAEDQVASAVEAAFAGRELTAPAFLVLAAGSAPASRIG